MSKLRSRRRQVHATRRSGGAPIGAAGRVFHLFGALALLFGLLLPLTEAGQALAAPQQLDPLSRAPSQDVETASFTQVAAIGDFQGQYGCNGFDINCPSTQLTNHDGLWTGVFPIPAGQWQWEIAALTQDGQQVTLSDQGVDQTGSLSIGEGDAGAWFFFSAPRQEADAAATAELATLSTDIGTYALEPASGAFSAIINSQGGAINAELQLDNAPVGNPQVIQLAQGANEVTVDASGTVVDVQDLGYATLTIARTDGATGQPLPGGCYEVRQGSTVVTRGCDTDDGTADGSTMLTFPEGLQPGSYTVAEVTAPQGAEQAPDQTVDLQQTDNAIEITTGEPAEEPTATEEEPTATEEETPTETGEGGVEPLPGTEVTEPTEELTPVETETPTEETGAPGDLIVTLEDQQGNPIGGACFQLIDDSGAVVAESCDINDAFPYNGNTGFFGVPSGTYTLHESMAPEGSEPAPDQQVQIPAGGEADVTVTAPAPEETPVADGDVVVLREDENGNPVGGACFELIDQNGLPVGDPVCDEDGDLPDDGRTGFFNIPAGTYTLHETRTPEGYEPAPDTQITVNAGQVTEQVMKSALVATEAPTEEATEAPTEELTPVETETPTEEATVEETPTEEPSPEQGPPGDLIITLHDQQGNPIGGACFELQQGETVIGPICDADDPFPDNGNTGFFGVPSGTYTLHQTTVPQGTEPIEDQQVTVPANGGDTVIVTAPAPVETPTEEATEEPTETETPTEEVTEAPTEAETPEETEEPTSPPSTTEGQVVVDVPAEATSQQVCVELNTSGGIGMLNAPEGCNTDTSDPGQIVLPDVPEGTYALFVTAGPEDLTGAEPQEVNVEAGQTTHVALQEAPAPTGDLPVLALDDNGNPLPGACWTLTDGDGNVTGPQCDDGANGDTADDGVVRFENIPTGDFTLTETTTPDGYQVPEPQDVTVNEGENPQVEVRHQLLVGTLTIQTVDDNENPLAGACYQVGDAGPVCDGGEGDTNPDPGVVGIANVPVGSHTVIQTTVPEGYQPAGEQPVEMTTEGATLTFQNLAAPGSIIVAVTDPDGNPVGGLCASVDSGDPVCDNGEGDASDVEGTIEIGGIQPGSHDVALTNVPEEFEQPDNQAATVEADAAATVQFALVRVPPTTGDLDVAVEMDTEEAVPGICVVLTNAENEQRGPFCDGDENDTNDAAGVIGIDGIPLGVWQVSLAPDTAVEGGDVAGANSPSVEVSAAQRAEALITIPRLPTTGTARIVTTDGNVNLAGACYDVTMGDQSISVCDNDDTDNDGTDGVIELLDVAPGTWTLTMTQAPEGYEPANGEITVEAGQVSEVEITLTAIPQPGSLQVTKVDENDKPLGGACFELRQNGRVIQSVCDDAGSGVMTIDGLDAGTYQLVETRAPSPAYQMAESQTVTIEAGTQTEVRVTNTAQPGRLTVITVKDSDRSERLDNACYRLEGDTTYGPFCDADDGTVDGRVQFRSVRAGEYTLVQTVAAPGYDPAPNRQVTIQAGVSMQVTVANKATPAPKETGTLVVIPLDEHGKPVPGGCYQVFDGDRPITGRVCDNADDVPARITFRDLPVGTFTLREQLAPSPAFVTAPDQQVTIRNGETTEVEVPHRLKDGRVLVQAVNTLGQPLQGACFDLTAAGGSGTDCTGTAGEILFNNVPAGTHSLKQTQAPHGYKLNETPRDVTVSPGTTAVVRVVFETAPPPDSGSVQVQKFFCPAGEEGERTQFLGGAEGNAQLSKTAGCTQGVASFTLVGQDNPDLGPGAFKTGADGRFQTTVKAGIYILTETDPKLGETNAARLRVGVGQMTTVIVINHVAPPKPAPTNIDVTSFTCPPSFNGTSYADFAASCTSEQAKTNNLTVRVEGAQKFKQVTGDRGKLGQTTFENLPAGKYVVYGDKPYNVPIMYLFCGANAADPSEVKAINGTVPVTLEGGQTITCQFFLVPEQLSKDAGAILVQKFSCPIDKPVKGYDWANECERSTTQVPFSLGLIDKETEEVQPISEIQANPDGLVRFINLAPGTYKLEEVGGKWCFAQSNSVDAKGNVVVNPNKLSEVWIYNCVGAHQPPNTGSGDAAPLLDPESGNTGATMLLNLAWPAVALVAWLAWRNRHGDHAPVIVRRDGDRAA